MKFYLVKDSRFQFDTGYQVDGNGVKYRTASVKANISPIGNVDQSSEWNCAQFKQLLESKPYPEVEPSRQTTANSSHAEKEEISSLSWKLFVNLGLNLEGPGSNLRKSFVRVYGVTSKDCLERIRNIAERHGLKVKMLVKFKNIGIFYKGKDVRTDILITNKTTLSSSSIWNAYLDCQNVYVSGWGCISSWKDLKFLDGTIDIECSLKEKNKHPISFPFLSQAKDINRKILEQEISSDLTILPSNGSPVKCHKAFLMAHSCVFDTMFKGSFEEAKTSIFKMPDMPEESVKALLKYMYTNEIYDAFESSAVALDLMQAGHKYVMQDLEEKMRQIIMKKPESWFGGDVAMRLYLFARVIEGGDDLKLKAAKIIKLNQASLKKSENYLQLFKEPEVAMELFESTNLI